MKREKNIFFSFGLVFGSEGRKHILERESPTYLYISQRLDRRFSSEQEEKLVYTVRATRGHRFFEVLTTPGGRGLPLFGLFLA